MFLQYLFKRIMSVLELYHTKMYITKNYYPKQLNFKSSWIFYLYFDYICHHMHRAIKSIKWLFIYCFLIVGYCKLFFLSLLYYLV